MWDWRRLRLAAVRAAQGVLDADAAEDAAQEALVRAWRHRGACATPGAPDAWVRSISRREALRIVGRPRVAAAPAAGDEPTSAPPAPAPVDVRRAMRLLDELDQRLVLRFYWAGQADHEIARDLRMPLGTVKVRLHRARLRLHDALGAGFWLGVCVPELSALGARAPPRAPCRGGSACGGPGTRTHRR